MRRLFISYARENKPDVDALVRDVESLGYETWLDSSLRGGQKWWDEILRRIADSDVFIAVVSAQSLNSVACRRELEWASALNKPVLPLAVGPLPDALPRALSTRQITTYSTSAREAAFALAGALGNLPAAQPAPSPLPEAPLAPLSYLTDLVDHVNQSEPLTHDQQREILVRLEPALDSADPEEARGARYVLETFSRRDDLYADIGQSLAKLGITAAPPTAPPQPVSTAARAGHVRKGVLVLAAVSLIAAALVAYFLNRPTPPPPPTTPPSASGGSLTPVPSEVPAPLTGHWEGRIVGGKSLEVIADITDVPPLTARVVYPELGCQCRWTQIASAAGGVRYVTETVDTGNCTGSQLKLVPQKDGTLQFSSTSSSGEKKLGPAVQGTLSRTP